MNKLTKKDLDKNKCEKCGYSPVFELGCVLIKADTAEEWSKAWDSYYEKSMKDHMKRKHPEENYPL